MITVKRLVRQKRVYEMARYMFIVGLFSFVVSPVQSAVAITYPYTVPDQLNASLNINTNSKVPFNHILIGLNLDHRGKHIKDQGYNLAYNKDEVLRIRPSCLRWPCGVWSNLYDWEVDSHRIYDGYRGEFYQRVTDNPGLRYGFPGFYELYKQLKFDVLWTWNINYDSVKKGMRRLRDRKQKGFEIKWIELGNESFWADQRSDAVATPEKYVEVAKAHAKAIKSEDPNIQISVPVTWRNTNGHLDWNETLRLDMSYYDAVTLHKYIRPGASIDGVKEVMNARQIMIDTAGQIRRMFPGKPIWLSEWSVDCGDNALTVLAMADVYLGIFNHTDLFVMSQYFQINGVMEPLFILNNDTEIYSKTSFGAAYEIIRSVFENSQVYDSMEESTEIASGLPAVRSQAVNKNGKVIVFAINKAPKSVPFVLKLDGQAYNQRAEHKALVFSSVNEFKMYDFDQETLETINSNANQLVLPALSLNVITISAVE